VDPGGEAPAQKRTTHQGLVDSTRPARRHCRGNCDGSCASRRKRVCLGFIGIEELSNLLAGLISWLVGLLLSHVHVSIHAPPRSKRPAPPFPPPPPPSIRFVIQTLSCFQVLLSWQGGFKILPKKNWGVWLFAFCSGKTTPTQHLITATRFIQS
jgi:hypothetical protein